MGDFFPIYLYFGLAAVVTGITLYLSSWIRSSSESATHFFPYESGIKREANLFRDRFPLRHYLVALIFLILDVEVIFLYPWAVVARKLGSFGFYEMLFFLAILGVGFIYIWRKGGLAWE